MTRKDYVVIADAIAKAMVRSETVMTSDVSFYIVDELCFAFYKDNTRFDTDKFLRYVDKSYKKMLIENEQKTTKEKACS